MIYLVLTGSTSHLSITNWRAVVTILLLFMLDGVYAEHAAHSDDNDIIIIYDNMVASGADGNKCLPMCRDPCTANRNCHESNKFICRYSHDL